MLQKLLLYVALTSGSLCFALIFVLVFLNGTEIACVRQTDQTYSCRTQTLLLGQFPVFGNDVDQVVDVVIVDDGCFEGCSYRAEFVLSNGSQVAVNEVYTDYNPVSKRVTELKRELSTGKASFEYSIEPLWWVAFLIGGLFLMEFIILTFTMGIPALRDYFASRDKLPV